MSAYAIGIDPGMAAIGIAVLEILPAEERVIELSVIRTAPSVKKRRILTREDNVRRTQEIATAIGRRLAVYQVRVICAEAMSFPRSASVAAKMAMCWGVIAAQATERGLPIQQASPQEIKRTLCGRSAASKDEVEAALRRRYSHASFERLLWGTPASLHEHACDALASVVACLDGDVVRAIRGGIAASATEGNTR